MKLLSSSECETTEDATSGTVSMLPNSPQQSYFTFISRVNSEDQQALSQEAIMTRLGSQIHFQDPRSRAVLRLGNGQNLEHGQNR